MTRLRTELEALHERARAAELAEERSAARLRVAFDELTAAAKAELRMIEEAHKAALQALEAEAHAAAGAVATEAPPDAENDGRGGS